MTRDRLLHRLHEAAELEHSLMCTYLYAAFSLRQGVAEGLSDAQADATARWRRALLDVAIEEMAHLAMVWNLTSALGGSPRFGRANFPTDPGLLPASLVVKLAPFDDAALQHFVFLERPETSDESDGVGFEPETGFRRGGPSDRLTPMGFDYRTVGALYRTIEDELRRFVASVGDEVAFCGPAGLQLGPSEIALDGVDRVTSLPTALAALESIVEQGEGASAASASSHFARFAAIRDELAAMRAEDPGFVPAHPAATNPVLRRPTRSTDRVHITDERASRTVDLANAGYALMLRLLGHAYVRLGPDPEKSLCVDLAIALMRAVTSLGERAARSPSGAASPQSNAGMSFTTLRDAAPLPPGDGARTYFVERFAELAAAAAELDREDPRTTAAAALLDRLARRAASGFGSGIG